MILTRNFAWYQEKSKVIYWLAQPSIHIRRYFHWTSPFAYYFFSVSELLRNMFSDYCGVIAEYLLGDLKTLEKESY